VSIGDLSNKLKERISQDREKLEQIAHDEFASLQQSLSASSKNALATIEADINTKLGSMSEAISNRLALLESRTGTLQKTLVASWAKSTALGLCLLLGLTLGAWGLSATMSARILTLWSELRELQQSRADLEQTVSNLERKTWGIRLVAKDQGKFIVLPPKTSIKTGWTIGNNEAIKLE